MFLFAVRTRERRDNSKQLYLLGSLTLGIRSFQKFVTSTNSLSTKITQIYFRSHQGGKLTQDKMTAISKSF